MKTIDITGVHPRQANAAVREAIASGERSIVLTGVNGQRFLGAGVVDKGVELRVEGTAGNDLAMLSDGISVHVAGNAQDGVANTMAGGRVVVDGHAGDVLGYGMRGGSVFVRGDIGYRAGINMKEFGEHRPTVVVGGRARDFLGEYMAGGVLVVLGIDSERTGPLVGDFTGAGMHGGVILVRGEVESWAVGRGLEVGPATDGDLATLRPLVQGYCDEFGCDADEIMDAAFTRIAPASSRPYGNLYAPM